MLRKILLCIFSFCLSLGSVHALISYTKPTKAEIDEATRSCIETGKSTDTSKYTCPEGAFQDGNGRVLSQQVVTCAVKMSLSFSAIDESAKKWMEELQQQREPDFNVWSTDIDATFSELNDTYYSICKTTTWTVGTSEEVSCVNTFDFFPETTCRKLARQKADAWRNAGYILAAKGIAKNSQNEKDEFIDQKKTKYSELVNKWNSYKRIVANAVAKMTAYIRSPVK